MQGDAQMLLKRLTRVRIRYEKLLSRAEGVLSSGRYNYDRTSFEVPRAKAEALQVAVDNLNEILHD